MTPEQQCESRFRIATGYTPIHSNAASPAIRLCFHNPLPLREKRGDKRGLSFLVRAVQVIPPAALRHAARQEAKTIADQPEETKGQLLDVSPTRKRRA